MIFSHGSFVAEASSGGCNPPGLLAPLVAVSRHAHESLRAELDQRKCKPLLENYEQIRKRMPSDRFGELRAAADLSVRASRGYFPAYGFFAGEYLNDEWLSAVDWHKGFHRDHVCHQVMSVYVTQKLLSRDREVRRLFGGRTLIDVCLDALLTSPETQYLRDYLERLGAGSCYLNDTPMARHNWEDLFREAATTAAMYHDCGYPWQFVSLMQNALCAHVPGGHLPTDSKAVLEAYRNRLFIYPLNGYQPILSDQPQAWTERCRAALEVGMATTHGLPGARTFTYLNDLLREYPNRAKARPIQRFCLDWAAMAIMMHDLEPLYSGDKGQPHPQLRVSLTRDPLSFVLTLVDQIQDFLRINAVFSNPNSSQSSQPAEPGVGPTSGVGIAALSHVDVSYRSACCAVRLSRNRGDLMITYYFENQGDLVSNRQIHKPKAEKAYFDPQRGYLDYSALPINGIRLQCESAASLRRKVGQK